MISRNSVYFGFFLFVFVCVAVIILVFHQGQQPNKLNEIQNFQDCAAAGYPVMQSYPRQCTLPNGKFFVEQQESAECASLSDCPDGFSCVNHLCQQLRE